MAVTATPIFVQAPRVAVAAIATANTNRDGSGTLVTVWTAGSDGSRIDHIDIAASGSTTDGVVRLYIHDGSTAFLWKELLVTAITPSTTIAVWSHSIDCSQPHNLLVMATGYTLRAAPHNAEAFKVFAIGGDF